MAAPTSQAPSHIAETGWLKRPETQAVFDALASKGFAVRAVGGAVRNALLGRPVTDVDIASPAQPQDVIDAARSAGLKAIPTGLEHGTVTIRSGEHAYEVTTLRQDVETFGRSARIAFTTDWTADARRRDFTLNALYCDADGRLFDPLGGYPDLAAHRVRFIGKARERIREDYLRILRFFRFSAEYGEGPADAVGLHACVAERAGLAQLSGERVRQELFNLLVARRGPEFVRIMLEYGLITYVLGMVPRPKLLERVASLEAALVLAPDRILRLAALLVETREDAGRLRDRLRLSNDEHALLVFAEVGNNAIGPGATEREARIALYRNGPAGYRRHVLLGWARAGDPVDDEGWRERWTLPGRWQAPVLPIGGNDVVALGIPAGPPVGTMLRKIENWWIASDFTPDRADLLAKLREFHRD